MTNPLMSQYAAGTLGSQLIFRRTPKSCAVYRHFSPTQPNTEAQSDHKILFSLLANRWTYLTQPEKDFWIPMAKATRVMAYNAYLGYNLRRLNAAQPDDLIGWWPNLVPAGDVLHDLTLNKNDGNFVDLNPDVAWPISSDRRGQVIEYDGTGYVEVPDPPSALTKYSWAFWFKQNAYTNASAIVDTGYLLRYLQAGFAGEACNHIMRNTWAASPATFLTDFTWHHYAGTWDGSQIKVYIDANLHATVPQAVPPAANVEMHFGATGVGIPLTGFQGQVDDLRFYDRCLQQGSINQLA